MVHSLAADGISCAGVEVETVLPPRPAPTQADGGLRQSDLPALPAPVVGHGFVYRLLDPVTAEPRYVGRTRTPAIRRHGHRSRRSKRRSRVTTWHRRLALHGLVPVMQILEGPVTYARAAIREEAWRRVHMAAGFDLLNALPCVDGRHEGDTIWTAEAARGEVRALASRLRLGGSYPTRRQLADAGLSGLDTAIERRLGGPAAATVRDLVDRLSLDSYPTQHQFVEARMSGLYRAIANRLGGHQAMAARLGLQPSDSRRR